MSYQELPTNDTKRKLNKLLESRRNKFQYIDQADGKFIRKDLLALNALAGSLHIPVLFYVSLYSLTVSTQAGFDTISLLSALFFAIGLGILIDLILGYILDHFLKSSSFLVKTVLTIIGVIGYVVTVILFFRESPDKDTGLERFRLTYMLLTVFYVLSNANTYKTAFNFVPSQEDRKKLFHLETVIQAVFLFFLAAGPAIIKRFSGDCSCKDECVKPESKDCLTCYQTCDTYSIELIRGVCIFFTIVAGGATIAQLFTLDVRKDEDAQVSSSTFNSRLIDFFENKFLLQTFFIVLIESFLLFNFAFWLGEILSKTFAVTAECISAGKGYTCTGSFTLEMVLFAGLIFAAFFYFISGVKNIDFFLWRITPLIVLGVGIYVVRTEDFGKMSTWISIIAVLLLLATTTMTRLNFSDAVFYDEYLGGSTQPYFPISIFLLASKVGFFLSIAFMYSLSGDNGMLKGYAIQLIAVSAVLFGLRHLLARYDLYAFDKIHLAIERNLHEGDEISFYDPIKKDMITRPLQALDPTQRKFIDLAKNLRKKDIMKAIYGDYEEVERVARNYMIVFAILLIADTIILIFYADAFATIWSWFSFIGLALLPILSLGLLYQYNVWATAGKLGSNKFANLERTFLMKVAKTIDPNEV